MSSVAEVLLATLEAAGGVCEIACPGCKAVVNLAEVLAKLALTSQATEAQQVASAEDAIFAADAAAVDALAKAHVTPAASVAHAAGVVHAVAQVPGTVKAWA